MAHFAELDENNFVLQVLVVNNDDVDNLPFPESEPIGIAFLHGLLGDDKRWAQTSYSAAFRYNYAGIGYSFDSAAQPNGAFISPPPAPEGWVLDTNTYKWVKQVTQSDSPTVL